MKIKKIFYNCIKYITNAKYRALVNINLGFYNHMPDEDFLKKSYKIRMHRDLDLENPNTFNEKIQWLKLYDRKPEYTRMVDKYEAKKYVAEIIGDEYIIPTLGAWDNFNDIDFDSLPNQFVLKTTHDSGGIVICRDKSNFNKKKAKKKLNKSLKRDYYMLHREWPYKNVKKRIIAEQYMEDDYQLGSLTDYKFYCFGGTPKFLYVSKGLDNHKTASISFLTLDWEFAPYKRSDYFPLDELPKKPKNFDQMIEIANKLSTNISFLRVDLYEINEKIYFSELTFSPGSGYTVFEPNEWEHTFGDWITLPSKKTRE